MHPAYSVILFTCASGAGYGLLALLGLTALVADGGSGAGLVVLVGFLLSFILVTIGLLSSTAHLGRPMRAWRAFSQWRTSWLSREGVMAIVTYAAGGALALSWFFLDDGATSPLTRLLGTASIMAALATLWCTGMIYASLKTIRAWHNALVAPLYVLLGLMTGCVLFNALKAIIGGPSTPRSTWLALILLLASWILKTSYWSAIDDARRSHTIGAATGLGQFGRVRTLDPPHTQANFVMREMGFVVARRHIERLRRLSNLLLFVVPIILTLLLLAPPSLLAPALAIAAALSVLAGVLIERWLFFAEAEHVSMLYYGREAA